MSLPLRVQDLADLLKLLTQSTQASAPDNPAEQLSDYVPAPASGGETVAVADGTAFPNFGHGAAYTYRDGSSMYAKAEYA